MIVHPCFSWLVLQYTVMRKIKDLLYMCTYLPPRCHLRFFENLQTRNNLSNLKKKYSLNAARNHSDKVSLSRVLTDSSK